MTEELSASENVATLTWKANGTARDLRSWLGGGLRTVGKFDETEWLFHKFQDQPIPEIPAMCRFFASPGKVGINFIGDPAIQRLQGALLSILEAARAADLGNADIKSGLIWARRMPHTVSYLANRIVLRKLRLQGGSHPSADVLAKYLQRAVANSINLQAATLGLQPTALQEQEVTVRMIDDLGSTQLENGGKRMVIPRITRAVVALPLLLEGPWNVGGLAAHGNGYIKRLDQLAHFDPEAIPELGEAA